MAGGEPGDAAAGAVTCAIPASQDEIRASLSNRCAEDASWWAACAMAGVAPDQQNLSALQEEDRAREGTFQANALRDIFGNPFRPITLNPAWLTSTVLALAQGIYSEKAFDRMPILADALQDAGCDNEDILNHCRQQREHVRGCWVVDLLTGRKLME